MADVQYPLAKAVLAQLADTREPMWLKGKNERGSRRLAVRALQRGGPSVKPPVDVAL
jgi:hypothetical protein